MVALLLRNEACICHHIHGNPRSGHPHYHSIATYFITLPRISRGYRGIAVAPITMQVSSPDPPVGRGNFRAEVGLIENNFGLFIL